MKNKANARGCGTTILRGLCVIAGLFLMSSERVLSETEAELEDCYSATVMKVIDGDTYDILVEIGFDGLYKQDHVRISDIDTPETFKPKTPEEHERGVKAREFVKAIFAKSNTVYYRYEGNEKYGRLLGKIFVKQEEGSWKSIGQILKENGFAK